MPVKKQDSKRSLKERLLERFKQKECQCHPQIEHLEKCPVCRGRERSHRLFALLFVFIGGWIAWSYTHPDMPRFLNTTEKDMCDLSSEMKRADSGSFDSQLLLIEALSGECSELPFALKKRNYYLHETAKKGHAHSQYQLSILYKMGETLPRNYQESFHWLKKAAESKYMPAEYELAKRYKKGSLFVKANPNEFLFWLMRAGYNGSDKAAEELAYLYEKGIFVPENKIEAYKWYSLSTYKESHKLDLLELSMTAEEVKRAQSEASIMYRKIVDKIKK